MASLVGPQDQHFGSVQRFDMFQGCHMYVWGSHQKVAVEEDA